MKSYTDIDQSRKLTEILPLNSADMTWSKETTITDELEWYITLGLDSSITDNLFSYRHGYLVPAWSLASLLSVLPSGKALIHDKGNLGYKCICNNMDTGFHDNPVDACYEVILKLHELKKL